MTAKLTLPTTAQAAKALTRHLIRQLETPLETP